MTVCISLGIEKLCTRIHEISKQVKVNTKRSAESFGIQNHERAFESRITTSVIKISSK